MPYPLSLRLRHWARRSLRRAGAGRRATRLLASIEAQAECLADTLEYHLRGNHLLESAITLKLLAACFRGPAVARWERRADAVLEAELASSSCSTAATSSARRCTTRGSPTGCSTW